MSTLPEFTKKTQRLIVKVGTSLEPDGDWMPVLLLQVPGVSELIAIGFDGRFMDEKDLFVSVMGDMMRELGALRYGLVLTAWKVEGEDARRAADRGGSTAGMDRAETVVLTVGDAETEEHWFAEITRRPGQPPLLGEWKKYEGISEGRFVGLNAVLREVREGGS